MDTKIRMIMYIVLGVIVGYLLNNVDFSVLKKHVPVSCTYKDQTYKNGESFKDDCNTCTCAGGEVGCTLIACEQ